MSGRVPRGGGHVSQTPPSRTRHGAAFRPDPTSPVFEARGGRPLPGAAGKGEGAGDESLSGPLAHPNNLLKEAAFLSPDAHLAKWQKAINAGSINTLSQEITHEAWRRFDEEFWRFFTDASGSQVPLTFENQSDPAARVIPPAALRMALLKGTHGVKATQRFFTNLPHGWSPYDKFAELRDRFDIPDTISYRAEKLLKLYTGAPHRGSSYMDFAASVRTTTDATFDLFDSMEDLRAHSMLTRFLNGLDPAARTVVQMSLSQPYMHGEKLPSVEYLAKLLSDTAIVPSTSRQQLTLFAGAGALHTGSCFNFRKGSCKYGDKCKYSHDASATSSKTHNGGSGGAGGGARGGSRGKGGGVKPCSNCGAPKDWRNPHRNGRLTIAGNKYTCYVCGQTGHFSKACPVASSGKPIICSTCGGRNHSHVVCELLSAEKKESLKKGINIGVTGTLQQTYSAVMSPHAVGADPTASRQVSSSSSSNGFRARFVPTTGSATAFVAAPGGNTDQEIVNLSEQLYAQHCSSNSAFVLLQQGGVDNGLEEEFHDGHVCFDSGALVFTPAVERGRESPRLASVFRLRDRIWDAFPDPHDCTRV